ncbi:MAG: 2-C-methyl-D-erythritol 4-phosphate cytidylyltransferase, partial [Clostridia bacterium]|nr:2-C-methyl-D-erythritol 4-phosphate cytidylyltransferase [Clostridia bacterium]
AGTPDPKNFTSAVICAAGSSTRMEKLMGEPRKQFMELGGIPVVARTLLAYEAANTVHEIIVVAREDEMELYDGFKEKYGLTKLSKVVKGGATRQESARLGSDEVNDKCKYIAVADGARCLTTPEEIQRVCHAAYQYGAASAGIKATDTVKICDKSAFIESTPDRNYVWLAQTPQVFSTAIYRTAAYVCRDEGVEATDDNSMAEYIRIPVKMVACSRENIKITETTDLTFAEAILSLREKKAAESEDEP